MSARPVLISACLLGVNCRYDGTSNECPEVIEFLRKSGAIPVPICPEQLAGLTTPRPKAWFISGDGRRLLEGKARLVDEQGRDLSQTFVRGAEESLKIARRSGCEKAILKQRSPSCGSKTVHCEGKLIPGVGVTCALLEQNGLQVTGEDSLEKLK